MNVPEMVSRNWEIKLLSLVIALLIWYFITPATVIIQNHIPENTISTFKTP